jgi:hypothetical protein
VNFAAITLYVASQRVFILGMLSDFIMVDLKEHCICIKFCLKLGKSALEKHQMLKTAFSHNAMGRMKISEFSQFKSGKNLVEDCELSGHPSTKIEENSQNRQQ